MSFICCGFVVLEIFVRSIGWFIGIVLCTVVDMENDLYRKCEWKCRWASTGSIESLHTTIVSVPMVEPLGFVALQFQQEVQRPHRTNVRHIQLDRGRHWIDGKQKSQYQCNKILKTQKVEQLQIPFHSNSESLKR